MSVHAIAQLWIHDPMTYGWYVARFMDVFENYKGRVLVADESPVVLEGAWDGNKVVGGLISGRGFIEGLGRVPGISRNRDGLVFFPVALGAPTYSFIEDR